MDELLHLAWCIVMPFYKLYLRIVKRCRFARKAHLSYNTILEGRNLVARNSYVIATQMGYGSYVSNDCYLYNSSVGRYTCIGPRTVTVCGSHPVGKFVSIHPAFFSKKSPVGISYVSEQLFEEYIYADKNKKISVVIGNDVWIGSDVKIMEGITIGDGAIIASGAVVCKDVESYTLVAGVPAQKKKYRFEQKQIEWLQKVQWWNKPQIWIEENAKLFNNIEEFMVVIDKE